MVGWGGGCADLRLGIRWYPTHPSACISPLLWLSPLFLSFPVCCHSRRESAFLLQPMPCGGWPIHIHILYLPTNVGAGRIHDAYCAAWVGCVDVWVNFFCVADEIPNLP